MAITTYSELAATIQQWLARSDLGGSAQDFITLGENYLNYGGDPDTDPPLRCREMEAVTDLTPTAGVYTLPTDYLEYRRVVEKTSSRRELRYITPDRAEMLYPSRSGGLSESFTIIGSSLYPFPISTNDVELTYYQQIPALTEAAPTNWLLTKSPSVYLRAALLQAADFTRKPDEVVKNAAMLRGMVAGLNRTNLMGNYARAGVTVRGVTP